MCWLGWGWLPANIFFVCDVKLPNHYFTLYNACRMELRPKQFLKVPSETTLKMWAKSETKFLFFKKNTFIYMYQSVVDSFRKTPVHIHVPEGASQTTSEKMTATLESGRQLDKKIFLL